MTWDELVAAVAAVEYRPGWKVEIDRYWDSSAVRFRVEAAVMNSYDHSSIIEGGYDRIVPMAEIGLWSEGLFLSFLHNLFFEAEWHESCEFFKYKGYRPFDPHKVPKP